MLTDSYYSFQNKHHMSQYIGVYGLDIGASLNFLQQLTSLFKQLPVNIDSIYEHGFTPFISDKQTNMYFIK